MSSAGENDPHHPQSIACIRHISIYGFKSFKRKVKIGPFTNFSCVVGCNGSGKSVIGEALAFAFGAKPRMLRTKKSASLLNDDLRKEESKAFAKVSITMKLVTDTEIRISRIITKTSSQYFWKANGIKRALALPNFKEELTKINIDADALDRFIVMQSQQVLKARQPLELSKHLEELIGASHFEEKIKTIEMTIEKHVTEHSTLQENLNGIQHRRELISPDIHKWKEFDKQWKEFLSIKVTFLIKQEGILKDELCLFNTKLEDKSHKLAEIQSERCKHENALEQLKLEQKGIKILQKECSKSAATAEKQLETLKLELARVQVRLTATEKELSKQKSLDAKERADTITRQKVINKKLDDSLERLYKLEMEEETLLKEMSRMSPCSDKVDCEKAFVDEHTLLDMRISKIQEMLHLIDQHQKTSTAKVSDIGAEVESLRLELSTIKVLERKHETDVANAEEQISRIQRELRIRQLKISALMEELFSIEAQVTRLKKGLEGLESRAPLSSREEAAVDALMGRLKNKFHGRLSSLATIDDSMFKAVNAIFCNCINMATTFVTEDRDTANELISYFQTHRIGVASCEILAESLRPPVMWSSLPNSTNVAAEPVLSYIQCDCKYKGVFAKYLYNWLVVADRDAAISHLQGKGTKCNIVTVSGEIFKLDGEIVRTVNLHGKYLIRSAEHKSTSDFSANIPLCDIQEAKERSVHLDNKRLAIEAALSNEDKEVKTLEVQEKAMKQHMDQLQRGKSSTTVTISKLQDRIERKMIELDLAKSAIRSGHDQLLRDELQQLEKSKNVFLQNIQFAPRRNDGDNPRTPRLKELRNQIRETKLGINCLQKQLHQRNQKPTQCPLNKQVTTLRSKLTELKDELHSAQHEREGSLQRLQEGKKKLSSLEDKLQKSLKESAKLQKKEIHACEELENIAYSRRAIQEKLHKVVEVLKESCTDHYAKRACNRIKTSIGDDPSTFSDQGKCLAQREKMLIEFCMTLDADALNEDVMLKKKEILVTEQLEALNNDIESEKLLKDDLENQRLQTFREAIRKVNMHLSRIYRVLTKQGDAYLSYTDEKSLLFIDGVHFHVRPDHHKWRTFISLSGGQQALAALALSFSLQSVFPSAFYFFDEVDASLDTRNVQVVAEYIKKNTLAQYIMVSHRPQLYEYASTLVGVYHFEGASAAITTHFDDACNLHSNNKAQASSSDGDNQNVYKMKDI